MTEAVAVVPTEVVETPAITANSEPESTDSPSSSSEPSSSPPSTSPAEESSTHETTNGSAAPATATATASSSTPAMADVRRAASDLNLGSMLRFLRSGFFDSWIGISYLYKYPSEGIHTYLCNELYNLPDDDIEFYLVQLCVILLYRGSDSDALEKVILDKCSKSIHFALQVSWILQSYIEDPSIPANIREKSIRLREDCEIATVNCRRISRAHQRALSDGSANDIYEEHLLSMPPAAEQSIAFALTKKDRSEYFDSVLRFVEELGNISEYLKSVAIPQRQEQLVKEIDGLNERIPSGLYLPLWCASHPHHCIVRISGKEAKVLNSRERVPYIIYFEVIESGDLADREKIVNVIESIEGSAVSKQDGPQENENNPSTSCEKEANVQKDIADLMKKIKQHETLMALEKMTSSGDSNPASPAVTRPFEVEKDKKEAKEGSSSSDDETITVALPFGEEWSKKVARVRADSPYGHIPNWNLHSVIIKHGDDCRQEQLAIQLITQFQKIFQKAKLPLYLRPYHILVTSSTSGLIETVPDAMSIDQVKKLTNCNSLHEYFLKVYDGPNSQNYKIAQRNFVESMAAYSIVCYLLSIKDRHNGNILIDITGHIVHIDYGFMLSNSPGSLNWESAPFKLTDELIAVMDGNGSNVFHYFKALCIRGFMEVRKYSEKITLLVEMMMQGAKLPCFAGPQTVEALKERFALGLTEDECVEYVENLINQSIGNWRTRYYETFQYYTNGIK